MRQPPVYWVSGRLLNHLHRWLQSQSSLDAPLSDATPPATPHDRVPVEKLYALWNDAAEHHAPGFALHAGAAMAVHTLPTLGPLISVSSTTRSVLKTVVAGSSLVTNAAVTTFHPGAVSGAIYLRPLLPSHPIEAIESALAHWTRSIQLLSGRMLVPQAAHIPFRDVGRPHASFFGCPVVYGTDQAALVYSNTDLDTPLLGHDPDAEAMLRTLMDLRRQDVRTNAISQCRVALLSMRATSSTRIFETAEYMGTSTRSLQRSLRAENAQFRDVLDEVLSERAFRLLRQTELTLDDVAERLGYPRRSFNRAFSRWTGTSPGAYRKANSSS